MNSLRSILTYLAIASLLVSDAVVAVHSASCSHGASTVCSASLSGGEQAGSAKHCCCSHHGSSDHGSSDHGSSRGDEGDTSSVSPEKQNEHDSDQCTICRGALICRFAVVCDVTLPPTFEGLPNWVTVTEATVALGHEFSSALSERGPPA